jgi:peptide/nickel transport system substrate-binding protein
LPKAHPSGRLPLGLAVALAVAGLLGGCSPDRPDERARDDALAVLLPRDAEQLDPRFVTDPYGLKVSRLIFDSLVTIDPHTLEPIPQLAKRIEVETSTRYRVELQQGLHFSDGSVLDARDVVATFRSVVDSDLGSPYARTYRRIERMETPDRHTVVFHLTEPHATFITDLELPVMRAEDAGRQVGGPDAPAPVGAGPYRLVERVPGRLELAANPHWHGGKPRFPRIRMLVVRDDNTRALRMLAGAGDLALNAVPPLLVPMFEKDPEFEVRSADGISTSYIGLNTRAKTLRDVRVRRALAHAIDRPALIRHECGGRAQRAHGWIPPGHWAYTDDVRKYPYDPSRAEALLDAAGYPDPPGAAPRMELTLRTSTDRFRLSVARAIAAMLRRVGIEVDVRPSEVATLIADLNHGRFEMTMLQVPEVIEPHVLSWFFASHRIPGPQRAGGANRWRIRNEALDEAFERGRRRADRGVRTEAYARVQRILARELPVIPLWHDDVVAVVGSRAEGFRVPRDGRFSTLAR